MLKSQIPARFILHSAFVIQHSAFPLRPPSLIPLPMLVTAELRSPEELGEAWL